MPSDLSVLIVSYNTRDLLESCLRSLQRMAAEGEFALIVVDNASTDGSPDAVHLFFPQAKVIRLNSNIGFAAAVNRGLAEVQTNFIFLINPDTLIPRGTATKLHRFLLDTPSAAVAGSALTDPDGTPQTSTFKFPSLFREFWNFLPEMKSAIHLRQAAVRLGWARSGSAHLSAGKAAVPVESTSGAALMLRTEAVRQIGGFDERFFLYHEEMDLCTRLRKAGWGVYFVPDAQVIHWEARASGFRPNRLPDMPLLGWRVSGMDLLWHKHKTPTQHRLWRCQARGLLGLRILGNYACFALLPGGISARKRRIQDLMAARNLLRKHWSDSHSEG
jgi:GT2 family glycosyltransferase